MKLRNDKEINAFFASAHPGGADVPAAPTEQNSPIDFTDMHRLGWYL